MILAITSEVLLIAIAVMAFILFWCVLLFAISMFSGWRQLATVYGANAPLTGTRFRFQSAQMRFSCNYGSCLTVTVNAEGLGLSVGAPFRSGHAPLFIPWSEISVKRETGVFKIVTAVFTFDRVPNVPVRVSEKLAEKIAAAAAKERTEQAEGGSAI